MCSSVPFPAHFLKRIDSQVFFSLAVVKKEMGSFRGSVGLAHSYAAWINFVFLVGNKKGNLN
jgi:hypothetical protein